MIDQVYAGKAGIVEELEYRHQGDGVYLETSKGKGIVLSPDAYVMTSDGMMTQVINLKPDVFIEPHATMGCITKMEMVGGRQMLYSPTHSTSLVNGFRCALWLREV